MPLTKDQQKGADAFFKFLMSEDRTFILSGGAGVGKTYLMNHLKNNIGKRYIEACSLLGEPVKYRYAVYTATTNKAAEVLENTINEPVETIYSYLRLKVSEDFKTGKTRIVRKENWKIHQNAIVFIDEASMIDSTLYDEILAGIQDSKIVFVGDHAQMAPVSETLSPIYKGVNKDNFIFLSEPIRNAGSPALMSLCDQLRNTVETGIFKPIKEVPGSIEYLDPAQMEQKVKETFSTPYHNARILCYTNKRVQVYNEHIRTLQGKPKQLIPNDVQVVAQSFTDKGVNLSVEREIVVRSVDPTIHHYGFPLQEPGEPSLEYYYARISMIGSQIELRVRVPTDPMHLESILKRMAKKKLWQDYYVTKGTFIDLRGKEACTVYKSQGSTYDTVFMDIGNIGTSYDAEQVARMLFVGASRATTNLYLFGKLPGKYINNGGHSYDLESITL